MQSKSGAKLATEKLDSNKHIRHTMGGGSLANPEMMTVSKQALLDQFTGKGGHGMLSKQQLKLMKQLEK